MTTPKAKLAGLALIAALCAGFISGPTAPAWAGFDEGVAAYNRGDYLPESWAGDRALRVAATVSKQVAFQTKPEIALSQIEALLGEGVAPGTVLADAGHGNDTSFHAGVSARRHAARFHLWSW